MTDLKAIYEGIQNIRQFMSKYDYSAIFVGGNSFHITTFAKTGFMYGTGRQTNTIQWIFNSVCFRIKTQQYTNFRYNISIIAKL